MMMRLFFFLAFLPSRALAFAWQTRWNIYRDPIAGVTGGVGSNLLNVLADRWYVFLSNLIMAFSIVAFVWGATTMQGVATEEGNKENGKKIIIGALIGLTLAILAKAIIYFADAFIDPVNFPVCGSGGGPGCP